MATVNPDTQGMSDEEIALMEDFDTDGSPKEEESERQNREVLALPTDGAADDDTGADATEVVPTKTAPAAPAPKAEEAPEPTPAPFLPQFTAEVPADAAEQIKTLKTEERNAYRKLMDGELDFDAYDAVRERTNDAIDDLKTKALTASIFRQVNEQATAQSAKAEWLRNEAALMATFKSEGLDYKADDDKLTIFNRFLKTLAADPANEEKDAAWFLTEAHRSAKAYLGVAAKPVAPAPRKGVDLSQVPPTLGRVPPAADPTIAGDEFSHLQALSGGELEKAVAKMTPEQQERWLN